MKKAILTAVLMASVISIFAQSQSDTLYGNRGKRYVYTSPNVVNGNQAFFASSVSYSVNNVRIVHIEAGDWGERIGYSAIADYSLHDWSQRDLLKQNNEKAKLWVGGKLYVHSITTDKICFSLTFAGKLTGDNTFRDPLLVAVEHGYNLSYKVNNTILLTSAITGRYMSINMPDMYFSTGLVFLFK